MSVDVLERQWPAPAKLNLFLRIVGRRPDGYHELQTVFQFLDFGDRLRFESLPGGGLEMAEDLAGVGPGENLCLRAAQSLADRARDVGPPVRPGLRIHLDKRLPVGAGLGGGSSDAATTLVALNQIWGLGLGEDELADLGVCLGADVPVFVRGWAAWAEGVGERLRPLRLPEPFYAVVYPGCEVSTARVFGAPELTRNSPPLKMARSLETTEGFGEIFGLAGNDCEAVTRGLYPAVDEALRWLGARSARARMTGTGSAVFAPFESRALAERALDGLPSDWWGVVARGANRSALVQSGMAGVSAG